MTKPKVKLTVSHDRVAVVAKFSNGDEFKASVGRTGDRMSLAQLPDTPVVTQGEFKILQQFLAFRPGEINKTRFERIAATCEQATSIKHLVTIITT